MKLFVAYCADRHIDPVIRVFSTKEAAIAFAEAFVRQMCRHKEYIKKQRVSGRLYSATYSSEGDHVYVERAVLDPTD